MGTAAPVDAASPWTARRAGLKAALNLVMGGMLWMFGALVLGNGFEERYAASVLGVPALLLLAGLLIIPWSVLRTGRRLEARMPPAKAASSAYRTWILAFWLVHALGSCSTMQAASDCQAKGRAAPAYCVWLRS